MATESGLGSSGGAFRDDAARVRERLQRLATNLHWTWRPEAADLFASVSPKLWESSGHNPVRMLEEVEDGRLAELAADASFVAGVDREVAVLETHLGSPGWFGNAPEREKALGAEQKGRMFKAAYFCAEFGLTECLPIYAGGLGLLAGDHLKSASGLGLPLVGVGLLYERGYFRQTLDEDGGQAEFYRDIEPGHQPVRRVVDGQGAEVRVSVDLPGRRVQVAVWRCEVGKVALYLLDTDLPENEPRDREITSNLYMGDHDMRVRQELILGIGGVRALEAVGETPTVFHMNEGHSAFLALERIRAARAKNPRLSFDQAREAIAAGHVFTTHTPVPAGIDRFAPSLIAEYFRDSHEALGLDMEGLLALGRENVADRSEAFSMAVLAIRTSRFCNGVSKLHGRVSRGMWRNVWPGVPVEEVPIGHVTNGVHATGWVGERMAAVFDAAMGPGWREAPEDSRLWEKLEASSEEAIWRVRQEARAELVDWVRARLKARAGASGNAAGVAPEQVLDPRTLTIGFARRFAQYKRGTLLFRDPARLERLIRGERPVQLLIAGKAHPHDNGGKQLIRSIVRLARERKLEDRIVFLEDYNIDVARRLVQGCDIWLNTPIRGLEASGTSGMKAAMNGGIHVSTLDGWWDEGFASEVGYHIESIGVFDHDLPNEHRENFESDALYRLLEHQIVPEFYNREGGSDGVPRAWARRVCRCIARLTPQFNTHRMVKEYATKYYFPAHRLAGQLEVNGFAGSAALSDHVDRFRKHWPRVRVNSVQSDPVRGGASMDVSAIVELGGLLPNEVQVQLRRGLLDRNGELGQAANLVMEHEKDLHDGGHRYRVRFVPADSVREAWIVRVLPHDPMSVHSYFPGLIASGGLNRAHAHVESHA